MLKRGNARLKRTRTQLRQAEMHRNTCAVKTKQNLPRKQAKTHLNITNAVKETKSSGYARQNLGIRGNARGSVHKLSETEKAMKLKLEVMSRNLEPLRTLQNASE